MMIKKGDLLGLNNDKHVSKFLVVQVVRPNRFFYCYSYNEKIFQLLVYDPKHHYMLCPDYDSSVEPDIDLNALYYNLIDALDKLFGYTDDSDTDE